jgi:cation diffusion facilitator family transporter
MRLSKSFEYPRDLEDEFEKAKKIQWITIVYLVSAIMMMGIVMSKSQAMKTAWIEDILSLVPPVSFLVSSKIYTKASNKDFPYGYHRVISIAFLISSVALTSLGFLLLIDSVIKLIKTEHATISSAFIFGKQLWLGYIMIAVMVYSTIPVMILGNIKMPLAKKLSEKNLSTDAKMSRANWLTGVATIAGITGIGLGWWWTDAVAAIVICTDIINDGFNHLKDAMLDLMNRAPREVEGKKRNPLLSKIKKAIMEEDWVKDCDIRFRQEGHVLFGEAFIVPASESKLTIKIENLRDKINRLDWRIYDITITLIPKL